MTESARFLRILGLTAIVVSICVLLMFLIGGPRAPRDRDVPPRTDNASEVASLSPGSGARGELFASLRRASADRRATEPEWPALAVALARLKTLDGARVDSETGQLLLVGEHTDTAGPFLLEDITVALRAAFYERESVGMTIDEDPNDKEGPEMIVRFFAGTRNTHLGQVMFECDRLMKSLGLGQDNVTKNPLTLNVRGFYPRADLIHHMDGDRKAPSWTRFWINLATDRARPDSLDGKPLVEESADGSAIWFVHHRMYVDTRRMEDPGRGQSLRDAGGDTPSARRFADFLTEHYDEAAAEFPEFGALKQLARLVILAEWIRERGIAVDPEMFFADFSSGTTTKERTPTLWAPKVFPRRGGSVEVRVFGGVTLEPNTKYVIPKEKRADVMVTALTERQGELRAGRPAAWPGSDGVRRHVVPVGPPIRGPTAPSPLARQPLLVQEATASVTPTSRRRAARRKPGEADASGLLEDFELASYQVNGRLSLDFPSLRRIENRRASRTVTFTYGSAGTTYEVAVPAGLSLVSPSRDITIPFSLKPAFDSETLQPYFEAAHAPGIRYYPGTGHVRQPDGTAFRFAADGMLEELQLPNGPHLRFDYGKNRAPAVADAKLEAAGPRGPPRLVESPGTVTPSRTNSDDALFELTIQNVSTGTSGDVFGRKDAHLLVLR